MELHPDGRSLSDSRPSYAYGAVVKLLHASDEPFRCQWSVSHDLCEVRRTVLLIESIARQIAHAALAGHDRDPEKPDLEPGGAALYRMCPRGLKGHREVTALINQ